MTVAIIAIIAVLLVLGFGLLIFKLMKKTQTTVPNVADENAASRDNVVGVDEHGRKITESQEPASATRDASAFESLLRDEIHERGQEQPAADDD